MEARRSESTEQDVEPPLAAWHLPPVAAPQANGSPQAAPRDVDISGPNSPSFFGPASNVTINYNVYQLGSIEVPMKTEVTREGKTDEPLTAILRTVVHTMFQAHGQHYTRGELIKMLKLYGAGLGRIEDGSVIFVLRIDSREGLDKLWTEFSTGELARRLTEILLTDELTTEDRSQIAIRATILKSDYERGCKFFEELQDTKTKESATGTTPPSGLDKISKDYLECSICQERYQQPKVLDCQHSFCEQCLVKYRSIKYEDAREIPCPVCRRMSQLPDTGIQGLKTNFYITSLAEDVAFQAKVALLSGTSIHCELCEENSEATHRCLDCAQNVCANCRKTHNRITALSSHTIATLDDIRQGKVIQQKHHPKCERHPKEATRFYCRNCEQLICGDCTFLDHCKPEHVYIDCDSAASMHKQSVAKLCSPLENALQNLTKSQGTISRVKNELDKAIEGTMAEVRARAAEIRALVSAQENRILDRIKRLQNDRGEQLDEYEKTIGTMTEGIQHSLETAKDVTSTASDGDFLSLYPNISKDLTFQASQHPPIVNERLSFLKFKRGHEVDDIDFGELQPEGQWELLREFGKEGSGAGEFSGALGVAILESDEIAVADYENQRVVICSIEGCQKSTTPVQGRPRDVAANPTHDRLVVVCDGETDVKVFNKDRTLAFEFLTAPADEVMKTAVDLRSVAVKTDDTIVVGDTKRQVVTEHSPTDGLLFRTVPVRRAPTFIAVDYRDRLLISDGGPEVDVTDCNGDTLFTITPTVKDKRVRRCSGVSCDSSGIYLAIFDVTDTGHIHHYDFTGDFLCCVARGLHRPQGMAFTANGQQLAVAEWNSVKMYHVV